MADNAGHPAAIGTRREKDAATPPSGSGRCPDDRPLWPSSRTALPAAAVPQERLPRAHIARHVDWPRWLNVGDADNGFFGVFRFVFQCAPARRRCLHAEASLLQRSVRPARNSFSAYPDFSLTYSSPLKCPVGRRARSLPDRGKRNTRGSPESVPRCRRRTQSSCCSSSLCARAAVNGCRAAFNRPSAL